MNPEVKPGKPESKTDGRNFFKTLADEHHQILNALQEVKKQGVHTMEGRNALTAAKELLCKHFNKEDEILYPVLKNAAGKNQEKQITIDTHIEEMRKVTRFCQSFFEKYSISGGGIEFIKDFDKLYQLLESRLKKEEAVLYPNPIGIP